MGFLNKEYENILKVGDLIYFKIDKVVVEVLEIKTSNSEINEGNKENFRNYIFWSDIETLHMAKYSISFRSLIEKQNYPFYLFRNAVFSKIEK